MKTTKEQRAELRESGGMHDEIVMLLDDIETAEAEIERQKALFEETERARINAIGELRAFKQVTEAENERLKLVAVDAEAQERHWFQGWKVFRDKADAARADLAALRAGRVTDGWQSIESVPLGRPVMLGGYPNPGGPWVAGVHYLQDVH